MSAFLDHASTTPLRESAKSALIEALEALGNPSSVHSAGQKTRAILEDARDKIAKMRSREWRSHFKIEAKDSQRWTPTRTM